MREPDMPTQAPPTQANVFKTGNLTRDFQLKFADNGNAYAHGSVAVNRPGPSGTWEDKVTDFYDLTLFGTTAENATESLPKGTRVIVIGKPEIREYEDKEGNKQKGKGIAVQSIGPDLRWATCEVIRTEKQSAAAIDGGTDDGEPF